MIEYDDMDLFLQDSVPKDLIITDGNVTVSGTSYSVSNQTVLITNNVIELEQFSITQQISTSEELRFGSCSAAKCEFVMHENIPSIKDKVLKVYMYLNKDASTMLQIGLFKVFEDTLKNDKTKRTITAYDALYDVLNADVTSWYNTLLPNATSTTTISAMRASFFSHFNISVVSTTLANDAMVVGKTIDGEQITGSMILTAICEINGVFGIINNEGKFKFVELSADIDAGLFPSDTLYPANNLYPQDVNVDVDPIGSNHYFALDFEDYRAEAITKLVIRNGGTGSISVGTDGNTYTIEDNVLLYDKNASQLTTIANNLLPKIVNRYYTPATIDCIGNPCHEVGDPIRVNTTYRGIVTYILERHLNGIQALKDEYFAKGVKVYDENLNSISTQIKRINGKVVSLVVDTDHIESRVEDIEDGSASIIQQLNGSITAEVTRATGAEGTLSGRITTTAEAITSEVTRATNAEGTLSTRVTQNANSISSEVTRATNAEGNLSSRVTQTESDITSEVTRATGAEGSLSTRITQNANGISAEISRAQGAESSLSSSISAVAGEVSSKVSKGSIISEINQTAESIKISASKISLDGATNFVNSGSKGSVEINNGEIYTHDGSGSMRISSSSIEGSGTGGKTFAISQSTIHVGAIAGNSYVQLNSGTVPSINIGPSCVLSPGGGSGNKLLVNSQEVITSGTIGSQSVNYASSAGSASAISNNADTYKNLNAHGSTGTYTLTLQTVTINGHDYVIYAYQKP